MSDNFKPANLSKQTLEKLRELESQMREEMGQEIILIAYQHTEQEATR